MGEMSAEPTSRAGRCGAPHREGGRAGGRCQRPVQASISMGDRGPSLGIGVTLLCYKGPRKTLGAVPQDIHLRKFRKGSFYGKPGRSS